MHVYHETRVIHGTKKTTITLENANFAGKVICFLGKN